MRLVKMGRTSLLRLNSPTREYEGLTPDAKRFHDEYSLLGDIDDDGNITKRFRLPQKDELMMFNVVVSTCVSGGVPAGLGVPRGFFNWVFVDEAGQASEPEGTCHAVRYGSWLIILNSDGTRPDHDGSSNQCRSLRRPKATSANHPL